MPSVSFILGMIVFGATCEVGLAAKISSSEWLVQQVGISSRLDPPANFRIGQVVPAQTNLLAETAPAGVQGKWQSLFDNNPATLVTLTNFASSTNVPGFLIDLNKTNWIDRVVICGTNNELRSWNIATSANTLPLGLIAVSVGDTPQTMTNIGSCTIPYDAGNPISQPFDIRFSPASCRYVRIELQTRVNWPAWSANHNNEYGWMNVSNPVDHEWQLSEIELYGGTSSTGSNAIVLESNAPAPLQLAAGDLSYYLGELTGQPHPIITPAQTNNYGGILYCIADLKPLAPDYKTMTNDLANGMLPTNEVNINISGRVVTFTGWPYRCVDWSVWEFLERQGVRWVYPDVHGDYVPPQTNVDLSMLPLIFNTPFKTIFANWDVGSFQPWPPWVQQSIRQEYLYAWRNRWNASWNVGPIGGAEIPYRPATGVSLDSSYAEGFGGYPHNMTTAVPGRILATNSAWWGSSDGISYSPTASQFDMASSNAEAWISSKVIACDASFPEGTPGAGNAPLSLSYWNYAYNLLPVDSVLFSSDSNSVAANSLYGGPVTATTWVNDFATHSGGAYYKLLSSVAGIATNQTIGGLAYQDTFDPPASNYPPNVRMEVTMWGAPNLPITAAPNATMKSALDTWRQRVTTLNTYEYALLFTDYWQNDPRLPVPMVSSIIGTAQYLSSIGVVAGGTQATIDSLPYNPWDFYAYPRSRWNTNQTASAVEGEFFNGYYREAAAPMLAYYQAMENYEVGNNVDMHYKGYCYWMDTRTFPLYLLNQMQTNLTAGESLATNWYVINRVNFLSNNFAWLLTTRGITNKSQLTDYSSYPTMPSTGTYTITNVNMTPVSYVLNPGQVEHRGTDLNLNGNCETAETFNFTKAGNYRIDIICAGNYYYNVGVPATMEIVLGPSSTGFVPIANGFQTNSYILNIPTATAFDVGVIAPNPWAGAGYVTVRQINITAQ